MKRLKLFLPLAIFVGLALLFWRGLSLDPTHMPSALIDKPVPAFNLPRLDSGDPISAQVLKGKPYLLNVWATWCVACRVEHSFLLQLAQQGVRIIGLNYKDESPEAKRWLQRLGDPYELNIVDAGGRLGLDLGVFGAPETYVVDAKGVIRFKHVGIVDQNVWQEKIAPIYRSL